MNGSVNPDALLDVDLAATVFDIIRDIKDPERPENLSQLGVICEEDICVAVTDGRMDVKIVFTPTVPHCHLATLIGLCITAKLARDFPHKYKVRSESGHEVGSSGHTFLPRDVILTDAIIDDIAAHRSKGWVPPDRRCDNEADQRQGAGKCDPHPTSRKM